MQKRKFRRLMLIIKGIIGKCWTIIGKCRVVWQRKLIRFLLIAIGIIGILVLSLIGLFSYTPDTSVPFPYIPPPEGLYYIEATPLGLHDALFSHYLDPLVAQVFYVGESFIFKNVRLGGIERWRTETYITTGDVQFWALFPSDLKELKVGDVVDIIGICGGISKEYPAVIVVTNCLFLPAGVAPLPLPGGPVVIGGY